MATVILTPHSVAVGSINPTENGVVAAEKKWSPILSALLSLGKGRKDGWGDSVECRTPLPFL